ncbi:hypothetical protein H2248_011324 [Termitomyces sp. 'cryptogamus']|nr:hypothetical protein H2248_011324 [Termitomyces sp. 'cryptogamus']
MVSESDELVNFQRSLVAFTYAPSPRKFDTSSGLSALSRPSKRSLQSSTLAPAYNEQFDIEGLQAPGDTPGSSPKRKRARGYADPEVYAHLQGLPDILSENLDIIFCGINPGGKSAEIGHHYGHHSNHFWDCLYQAGFTPDKLFPEEDHTLPERFSIGLTNLVERPTAEQNELSSEEQAASVPTLLAKVTRYRPRILCFLGLNIARVFQSQLTFSTTPQFKGKKFTPGLQAYKMVHVGASDCVSDTIETLFYALPSPSARVVKPQVGARRLLAREILFLTEVQQKAAKIALFASFREILNQVKRGELMTDTLATITAPNS